MTSDKESKKTVPSYHYDRIYYLTDNEGYREFIESGGRELSPWVSKLLELANIKDKCFVLDLGRGRGKIPINCAFRGAQIIGLDFSEDAIQIAKESVRTLPEEIRERITLIRADACNLPFKSKLFDKILTADVIEELYPDELSRALVETNRILKNDGKLFIHTAPNKWYYDIGYRYYLRFVHLLIKPLVKKIAGEAAPKSKNPRGSSDYILHVNKLTYFTLKNFLKAANFQSRIWLSDTHKVKGLRSFVYYYLIRFHVWPLKLILSSHIWAVAQP